MRWTILLCLIGVATGSPMASPEYDTIVVGMGPAGSMAAAILAKAGKRVLALEAQDRIGGRVHTVPFGDGIVELGAEWIHGTENSSVYELAVQNNVTLLSQGLQFKIFRSDGSEADAEIVNDLLTFSLGVLEEPPEKPEPVGQYITRRVTAYIKDKYPQLSNDTDFMENYLKFADQVVNNYESSNSWDDITTASAYTELGGDQHMSWHTHGYKTLFDIILNKYKSGSGLPSLTLKLNSEVVLIKWPKDSAGPVEVTTKDGTEYRAQHVIVTVSLGVLKERHATLFSPSLPDDKTHAIENMSIGVVDKITFRFPHRWCHAESCLFMWRSDDAAAVPDEDKWLTLSEGVSVPMSCRTCGTLWLNGDRAKHASLFSPPLPQEKVEAIEGLSIGVVDKIELRFEEAWWPRHPDFFGFIWREEDRKALPDCDLWTTQVFGASNPLGHRRVLTVWTSGDSAKLVETLPDDVVKSKVMALIRRFMGADVPEPLEMIRSSWFSNPFTRGSYTYDGTRTPQLGALRAVLGTPLAGPAGEPRVLFAGEATNPIHFSTVHGALETGRREADRLLRTNSKL